MELNEKEVATVGEVKEETVEIEDVDVGLKKEDVEVIEKEVEKKVKEQHVLNKEQQEIFQKMIDAAKMPVKMKDSDFVLGENELDIRYLSKMNREQMFFRQLTLMNVWIKECFTSLIDISRLVMIIADKLGVENIVEKTDYIIDKIEKETKLKETLSQAKKAEDKEEEIKA